MNSTATNVGGWNACERRTWCNTVLPQAFPETLRPIFKQMNVITANGAGTTAVTSEDTFALPAEKEIFGTNQHGNATAEASLFQLKYFETASNRPKKVNGSQQPYFERSPITNGQYANINYCGVDMYGTSNFNQNPTAQQGLAPIGCI